MKKIVSAALAASLLAGAAFAEFTVTGNARVYSDVFTYDSPSRNSQSGTVDADGTALSTTPDADGNGTDDNGTVNMAKATTYNDDVTIQAKGEKSGAKIALSVKSNTDGSANGGVSLTSYQLWTAFGDWRLDAGAYDQRLAKNLNADGNWSKGWATNGNKPGIWTKFGGNSWGADAANITSINGAKRYMNFQVSNSKLVDGLTLRGVVFLTADGTATNGADTDHDEKWIFTPFALGGTYQLDKDTQFNFNAKLSSITHGKKTAAGADSYATVVAQENTKGKTTYYKLGTNGAIGDAYTTTDTISAGTVYIAKTAGSSASYTPDKSVWTLNANIYKKLSSALEIEAHYTLGMVLLSNWSGLGAYQTATYAKGGDRLVRDEDVFAHGFDFRAQDKLSDKVTLLAAASVNYIQGTARQKAVNDRTPKTGTTAKTTFKDARAKSYSTGAAGTLAYNVGLGVNYKQSDTITFQVQGNVANTNLFAVSAGDSSKEHVDYYRNTTIHLRPAVIVDADKTSQFFAGVDLALSGFLRNATSKNNTFKTTTTIPVGLRVKL